MKEDLPDCFKYIYKQNLVLLDAVREERWQQFITLAERYIFLLNDAIDYVPENMSTDEKEMLRVLIRQLLENEKEIADRLARRLSSLTEQMSLMQQGKQCSQFYNLQALSLQLGFH